MALIYVAECGNEERKKKGRGSKRGSDQSQREFRLVIFSQQPHASACMEFRLNIPTMGIHQPSTAILLSSKKRVSCRRHISFVLEHAMISVDRGHLLRRPVPSPNGKLYVPPEIPLAPRIRRSVTMYHKPTRVSVGV